MRRTYYLGIDPGKQGGLAVISKDGSSVVAWIMPDGLEALWDLFKALPRIKTASLEFVNSYQAGRSSAFTFGFGFGALQLALVARGIDYGLVMPTTWQRSFGIKPRKKGKHKKKGERDETVTQYKDRLRRRAIKTFPNLSCWDWNLGEQRAVSDALLLAEYCRRQHCGPL